MASRPRRGQFRERLPVLRYTSGNELRQTGSPEEQRPRPACLLHRLRERHGSDEYRADEEAEIMQRKNFAATGGFIAEDRSRALDLLGFSSQLIFNTFHNQRCTTWSTAATPSSPTGPRVRTTAACSSSAR